MNDVFQRIKADGEVFGISPVYARVKCVIIAFSGGADSSLLLSYFVHLRDTEADFPEIVAVHVNHMLRGDESDGDEAFCRRRCEELGVPLRVFRLDIPKIMAETGQGCEECARNARYDALSQVKDGFGDAVIATAHNADDNLETVLFNLARGAGTQGLSGIPPIRSDGVIRPILGLGSAEIRKCCHELGIPFVTDGTNTDEGYTRNFIRHSVVPLVKKINPAAADASVRAGISLREDEDFIRGLAMEAIGFCLPQHEVARGLMASLPDAVLSRAILMLVGTVTDIVPCAESVRACRRLVRAEGTGRLSLGGGVCFEASKNFVHVYRDREVVPFSFDVELPSGDDFVKYSCAEGGFDLFFCRNLSGLRVEDENIYKLSIYTAVRFDTIYGRAIVRSRLPGDTLYLGGCHRKLKKMICDSGVPEGRRDRLPVICDDDGVLLVPGLPVRGPSYARTEDLEGDNAVYVLYCLWEDF